MAPKEQKISKQAAAGTTRDMILTILETLETIRKPESATSSIQDWIVDHVRFKETYGHNFL
jgi:hypothetical protein